MSLAVFWYYCPVYGSVYWFNGPVSNLARSIKRGYGDKDLVRERKEIRDTDLSASVIYS